MDKNKTLPVISIAFHLSDVVVLLLGLVQVPKERAQRLFIDDFTADANNWTHAEVYKSAQIQPARSLKNKNIIFLQFNVNFLVAFLVFLNFEHVNKLSNLTDFVKRICCVGSIR